jgi:hypothetical protein
LREVPMKARVIATIKIQENGRVMLRAQPSDREAVLMALKPALVWMDADYCATRRPLGYMLVDYGQLKVGLDEPSESVTIDIFDEMMVGLTKKDARALARRLEDYADELEPRQ